MSGKSNNVYKPKMAAFLIATIMLVLVMVVIVLSTILILSAGVKGTTTTTTASSYTPTWTTTPATTTTPAPVVTTTPSVTTTKKPDVPDTPIIPGADTVVMEKSQVGLGSLVLIDNQHFYTKEGLIRHPSLNASTASKLGFGALSGNTGHYKLRQGNLYLDLDARGAFNQMMADLAAISSGDVQVRNAYYYSADLTAITDQDSLETVEHSTGRVVDLEINQDGKIYPLNHPSLKATFYDWIVENCWKYGFIHLRDTSKYSTFRYIGVPHAAALHKDAQMNFSTYLTVVTAYNFDNRMKVTDANGAEWWIYYVKAESDVVNIPVLGDESVYQISGDNQGGFIVAIDSSKFAK